MAKGILGASSLTANTVKTVYPGPTTGSATVTVNFVNKTDAACWLTVIKGPTVDSLTDPDFLDYRVPVPPRGTYARTGIRVDSSSTDKITVETDCASSNCVVFGIET